MKVTLILKGAKDHFGRMPVVIRTSDKQKRTFRQTNLRLTKEQFERFSNNTHLPKERDLYQRFLSCMDTPAAAPFPDADFKTFAYQCLREWNGTKKGSTIYQYKGEIDRFLAFTGPVKMGRVTVQLLNDYKVHLLKDRSNNTAWKTFKALKTIFNKAVKERVIELSPFAQFENIKYRNPQKKYLTREQIGTIEDYLNEDIPDTLRLVAAWFVISCYTGLRYSDAQKHDKKRIKGGRLILYTTKTGEPVSLPYNDKLKVLFESIQHRPLSFSNQKVNEYLKVIARACELPPLAYHQSRHSFATQCAESGISPEVTAKLMGITNLRTVAIYYRLTSSRIDSEYNRLFN